MPDSDNILVGTWQLQDADKKAPSEEMLLMTSGESTLLVDNRNAVSADDIKNGGKYRSVVKLQIHFETQNSDAAWAMATGWLIQPDVVITAGHCAYDWSNQMGRAVRVKAYIGYNGRDSIDTDDVQFRKGTQIVTTSGWLSSEQNRTNDVSFIKLDSAFTGTLNLITYASTPTTGSEALGVVGYPADKKKKDSKGKDERGAQMYYEFESVDWDLSKSYKNLLEYAISTYAGNSGSPVLRSRKDSNGKWVSLATHAYGGLSKNSGSPIAPSYGNPYGSYTLVFDGTYPTVKTVNNINYVSVPYSAEPEVSLSDAWDVILSIGAPVASDILTVSAPFLGPVGGPVAALAAAVLGYAGSLTELNMGSEASFNKPTDLTGFAERGIIAEASLQMILDMSYKDYKALKLDQDMLDAYNIVAPSIYRLGPKLFPVLMQPATRIGLDAFRKECDENARLQKIINGLKNGNPEADPPAPQRQSLTHPAVAESSTDANLLDFLNNMWAETYPVQGEESFFDELGDVIYNAGINTRTMNDTAPGGICFLSSIAAASGVGLPQSDTDTDLQTLCLRAAVGEAVLRALIKANHTTMQSEGCFDGIKTAAQQFGRTVLDCTPWVIDKLTPILMELLKGQKASAGAFPNNGASNIVKAAASTSSKMKTNDEATKSAAIRQMKKRAADSLRGLNAREGTVSRMLMDRLSQSVNMDGLFISK